MIGEAKAVPSLNGKSAAKSAIVIGGGWAGLSAAVELADRGWKVDLLEQSGRLGGRASSFTDEKTGQVLDNGQHLFMGCYTATLAFLRKIGTLGLLKFQKDLSVNFAGPTGRVSTLKCLPLPAPFHLLTGLMGLNTLSLREKWSMIRVHNALRGWSREQTDALTAEQWLKSLGQSDNSFRAFWEPIIIATLNEQGSVADATSLAVVLREAFFSDKEKSQIAISTVGLSELVEPAAKFVADRGGSVATHQLAARVAVEGGLVRRVAMRDGRELTADLYVSAVPFFVLGNLLGDAVDDPFFAGLKELDSSPIFSIALWFDRAVTDKVFVGMLDTEVQWLFNKSRIFARAHPEGYVSLVISGARKHLGRTNEELLALCLKELNQCFPASREAKLLNWKIIREKNATLSPRVGAFRHRLPQRTPVPNLLLCGDWTDTGFPATIESAVVSGVRAAQAAGSAVPEAASSKQGGVQ